MINAQNTNMWREIYPNVFIFTNHNILSSYCWDLYLYMIYRQKGTLTLTLLRNKHLIRSNNKAQFITQTEGMQLVDFNPPATQSFCNLAMKCFHFVVF